MSTQFVNQVKVESSEPIDWHLNDRGVDDVDDVTENDVKPSKILPSVLKRIVKEFRLTIALPSSWASSGRNESQLRVLRWFTSFVTQSSLPSPPPIKNLENNPDENPTRIFKNGSEM